MDRRQFLERAAMLAALAVGVPATVQAAAVGHGTGGTVKQVVVSGFPLDIIVRRQVPFSTESGDIYYTNVIGWKGWVNGRQYGDYVCTNDDPSGPLLKECIQLLKEQAEMVIDQVLSK